MILGYPVAELATFAAVLASAGIVAGLLAGMLGIGGGAVMVPVLYQFFELISVPESIRMHLAVGTSLAIIVPTSVNSFRAHLQRKAVDVPLLKSWIAPVVVGVVLASAVAAYVSGAWLRGIFAVIALMVALKLLFGKDDWRIGSDIPGQPLRSAFGVGIGFFSTLMGIGGGILNNTLMTLYGRPIHQAVATSSGLGFVISVPATAGFAWAGWGNPDLPPLSVGYVSVLGALMVIPPSVLAAPWGAKIAHSLSPRKLGFAFGVFLLIVAARFFATLF